MNHSLTFCRRSHVHTPNLMKICEAVITSTDISKPFSKKKYVIIHYVVPLIRATDSEPNGKIKWYLYLQPIIWCYYCHYYNNMNSNTATLKRFSMCICLFLSFAKSLDRKSTLISVNAWRLLFGFIPLLS